MTLHGVTPTHAFFCISKYDVYDAKTYPFTFLLQFLQSHKMVIVPHSTFHRLADSVGDPKVCEDGRAITRQVNRAWFQDRRVTLLNMTARCGSTLVGQMLTRVPNVRVISEPWAFMHLHGFYVQRLISLPQYMRLLKSCLRLQCKRERFGYTHLFIKMSNFAGPAFPLLKQLFPDVEQMFITRHFKPSLVSYVKVMRALPQLWYKLGRTYDFWMKHFRYVQD